MAKVAFKIVSGSDRPDPVFRCKRCKKLMLASECADHAVTEHRAGSIALNYTEG